MNYKPIIFSADMVRAILAGQKTQTRRVAKKKHDPLCPYGYAGDRLWVRETWTDQHVFTDPVIYKADYDPATVPGSNVINFHRWKPSIHMPRAVSRLTLQVTAVRVEHVQDISEADAIAEGIAETGTMYKNGNQSKPLYKTYRKPIAPGVEAVTIDPIWSFTCLWQKINGKHAGARWQDNPLVWVVEFQVVEPLLDVRPVSK